MQSTSPSNLARVEAAISAPPRPQRHSEPVDNVCQFIESTLNGNTELTSEQKKTFIKIVNTIEGGSEPSLQLQLNGTDYNISYDATKKCINITQHDNLNARRTIHDIDIEHLRERANKLNNQQTDTEPTGSASASSNPLSGGGSANPEGGAVETPPTTPPTPSETAGNATNTDSTDTPVPPAPPAQSRWGRVLSWCPSAVGAMVTVAGTAGTANWFNSYVENQDELPMGVYNNIPAIYYAITCANLGAGYITTSLINFVKNHCYTGSNEQPPTSYRQRLHTNRNPLAIFNGALTTAGVATGLAAAAITDVMPDNTGTSATMFAAPIASGVAMVGATIGLISKCFKPNAQPPGNDEQRPLLGNNRPNRSSNPSSTDYGTQNPVPPVPPDSLA